MIIFLYGEDTYRLKENRATVLSSYRTKHKSGFNLFEIDASEPEALARIADALKSVSLFDEVKLLHVSGLFSDSEIAEKFVSLLKELKIASEPKIVVLVTHMGSATEAKPKEAFVFLANEKNLVRNFASLTGIKLQNWIKQEGKAQNLVFGPGALARFVAIGGKDSWARILNLQKLANYSQGQPVSAATVSQLIGSDAAEPNIFEFIDAWGSGRSVQAFGLLAAELNYGRDPYYLLSMIMYQVRNMLLVKDLSDRNLSAAAISQKSSLHPFVVKKMLSAVQKLSLGDIRSLYSHVLDLEQGTKQGRQDLEDGLYQLVFR